MVAVEATLDANTEDAEDLRGLFLLDPEVAFLNHGSFGATPAPVFEVYQAWQRELERQPVAFLLRRSDDLLDAARARLGAYLNVPADDLVFVSNATTGLNIFARSLRLEPGDEVLATDHEYGALDLTWGHVCARSGARYVRRQIPLPVTSPQELAESFWAAVTPRTRVVFLSQITSPTALTFPVAEICRRAREAGILSVVDGAHVPGQRPLDLAEVGADVYAGNCHKWLCAPKGSAFLHVRPEHQDYVEAATVSWGWGEGGLAFGTAETPRSQFVRRNQWQGTRDLAAFLAVPAAIDFQAAHDWDRVRVRCHALARVARDRIGALTGLPPIAPDGPVGATEDPWYAQMVAVPLPPVDAVELMRRLYDEYRVEVPITAHGERPLIRVSVQGYNTVGDIDRLLDALAALLPA
jgi:isopenicillin-N epimerase